jgi:hypothetical protein
MDSLHAMGFYVSAALSVTGGLVAAFVPTRAARGIALAVAGVGVGGIYVSLSAGVAGLVALICFAGCALLLARPDYRSMASAAGSRWRQLGALGAGGLLVMLAYSAFNGSFAKGVHADGPLASTAVARLLLAHDALATEAVGALVLIAMVGAAVAWRARDRSR